MAFDLPTLIVVIIIVSACAALALVFLRLGHIEEPGLGDLALGVGLQGAGILLESLSTALLPLPHWTLGCALMVGGLAYQRNAVRHLYQRPISRWHPLLVMLLTLGALLWLRHARLGNWANHTLLGALSCAYLAFIALELSRRNTEEVWAGPRLLCMALYLFHGVAGLVWNLTIFGSPSWKEASGIFSRPNPDALYLLVSLVVSVFLGIAFALLVGQRLLSRQRHIAQTDLLTGLPNRRGFMEQVQRAFHRAVGSKEKLGLLVMDVDHFKQINDAYGHAAGDRSLVTFANRVETCLRESDVAGRIGGEEFAVLLRATDLHGALQVAERIRATVSQHPVDDDRHTIQLTVSIGVASTEEGVPSIDALFRLADRRLYHAKEEGRNQVVGFGLETHYGPVMS